MAEEAALRRTMPNNLIAEQSVIGSMLIDKDNISVASEILTGEDFYNRQLGMIFDAMVELYTEGQPVDVVTLQNKLKENGAPAEVYGLDNLGSIIANVPTSVNMESYAKIVAEKATLRKLIHMSEKIENTCFEDKESMDAIVELAEHDIYEIARKRNSGELVKIDVAVMNALEKIQAAYKAKGTVTGISTGFVDLDYDTSGFQPSDFILIAARPSMGKTAFVLNIASHMALKEKKGVMIFSLEMSKEQLVNRMFALEARVDATKLRNGRLDDNEWEKLVEAASKVGDSNLIIDDTPSITVAELRSKARKFSAEKKLDIIIIDYLQLMSGSGKSESRTQEVSEISRALKGLARELNIPVIALSQLSRAVESRPDKRPMMSDLRESGAIEQDADVVMFIYREDYYKKDTEEKNISEIIIGKQRNGPVGTVKLAWLPQYTKFANLDKVEKKPKEE